MPTSKMIDVEGVTIGGTPLKGAVSRARMTVRRAKQKPRTPRLTHLSVPAAWLTRFQREAEREVQERRAREAGQVVGAITPAKPRRRGRAA